MPSVKDILATKGSHVLSVSKSATVMDAALLMNEHKIGALVVTENNRRVLGIFTERDVLQRVVAVSRDPATTLIEEVMSTEIACASPDTKLEEARSVFKNRRIRHLPVIDEQEQLVGVISIGDLNAYDSHTKETTIHFLHEYLYGTPDAGSGI